MIQELRTESVEEIACLCSSSCSNNTFHAYKESWCNFKFDHDHEQTASKSS